MCKRAQAPTPVIRAGVWAGTVVRVDWHTHLQCVDGLRYVVGINVSFVSNSIISQQCYPGEGECAAAVWLWHLPFLSKFEFLQRT